jgi:hypothetical protein
MKVTALAFYIHLKWDLASITRWGFMNIARLASICGRHSRCLALAKTSLWLHRVQKPDILNPGHRSTPGRFFNRNTKTAPYLDGSADDTTWRVAPVRVMQANGEGVKPYPVTLKVAYDEQNIYILVQFPDANMEVDRSPWAFDASAHVWGRLGDDLGDEDEMGFFV